MAIIRQNPRGFSAKDAEELLEADISHLDVNLLRRCVSERGKIYSSRKNGVSAKLQRRLRRLILHARYLALLPYAPDHRLVTTTLSKSEKTTTRSDTANTAVANRATANN